MKQSTTRFTSWELVASLGRPVKTSRSYDASGRQADARARREAVLDVARALFLANGFGGTTVAEIATAGGVSAETVYKSFGGKTGLVRALHKDALRGAGPVPAEDTSDNLRRGTDPHEVVRGWARLATEVAPRVVPILRLVRDAAAVDPTMRTVYHEMDESRLRRMTENAQYLHDAGHLRADVTLADAADLMWSVSSPEMFELFVVRRGWSLDHYADFVYNTLANGLLPAC